VREREAGRGRGGIRRRKKGGEKRRIWRPEGRKNSAFFPLYLSLTVPERLVRVVEPRVPSCLVLVLLEPAQGARGKVAHFLLQRIGDAAASSGKKKKSRSEFVPPDSLSLASVQIRERSLAPFSFKTSEQRKEKSPKEEKGGRETTRRGRAGDKRKSK